MDEDKVVHLRITGHVQGVWYRQWLIDEATRLGLKGWVRNRRDGSVEAVVAGPAAAVAEAVELCRRGPPMARVDDVVETPENGEVGPGFRAAPTV